MTINPWEVKNRPNLLDHGCIEARSTILDLTSDTLRGVHPTSLVPNHLQRTDHSIVVDEVEIELDASSTVSILGVGKGSVDFVESVQAIVGSNVERAVAVEKRGNVDRSPTIQVIEASHPIPDESSIVAGEQILRFASNCDKNDIVLLCISGGASSLLAVPLPPIEITDLQRVNRLLLESGATIDEINVVRKAMSKIKGGGLLEQLQPATVISLILVDEVSGQPWGPSISDPVNGADAIRILKRFELWTRMPKSVKHVLTDNYETKDPLHEYASQARHFVSIVGDSATLCDAAVSACAARDLNHLVLSSVIEGESQEVATVHAGICREIAEHGRPIEPPAVLISGGETTVTLEASEYGSGGPNQEFALAFTQSIPENCDVTMISIDTDGSDGPTQWAGGIIDRQTRSRLDTAGVDINHMLSAHASSHALEVIGDAVETGPTGTNVMDLRLFLIDS